MIFTLDHMRDAIVRHPHTAILVSGGFDPLHYGHVRFFRNAQSIARGRWGGDLAVVVAVAPDEYVQRKHPLLQTLEHRMEMIDGIRYVDAVVSQDEGTAATAIRAVRPLIFLKGDDWKARGLPKVELEACEEVGARVEYVAVQPISSSEMLRDYFWGLADQMGRH